MNKAAIPLAALVLAGAVTPIVLQQKTIRQLRSGLARLQERAVTTEADSTAQRVPGPEAAELERLRQERSELLRLRGEVARLRQQLAEASAKRSSISLKPATRQPADVESEPVQTFVANANATIGAGQALVFGGWPTPPGKYTFVFFQPEIAENTQNPAIQLQGTIAEIPDEMVTTLGLESLKAGSRATAGQGLLSSDELKTLLKTLKSSEGASILASPRVQTGNGMPASMSITEQKTIGGEQHTLGPSLDIEPRIAADGSSVNLTISAKLKKANEAK